MAVSIEAADGFFKEQIVPERTHPIVRAAIEEAGRMVTAVTVVNTVVSNAFLYVGQRAFNEKLTGWGDLMIIPPVVYCVARAINLS